ncbi:MAG TPA: hypothetical protein VIY09_03175 [Rhizomicrobium sp.]
MLANALKTTAMAALLGLGVAGAAATPASADTVRSRCDGDNCVRLQCNDYGYDCFRIGYYDRGYYSRDYDDQGGSYGYAPAYSYAPAYNYTPDYYPDYAAPGYWDGYNYDRAAPYSYDEDDYPG